MFEKNKKGSALLVTLMILGVILVSALSVSFVALQEFKSSKGSSKTVSTYQLADEGIEAVMYEITMGDYDTISDLSNCQSNGRIENSSSGYEVILYDEDDNVLHCVDDGALSISSIKKIKAVGTLEGQNQRGLTTYVPIACNDENDDDYTELLLHFDGGDDGDTIVDATGKHSISEIGTLRIDKSERKFCRSAYFYGSDDYVRASNSDELNFGVGNFTIDFWIYPESLPDSSNKYVLFAKRTDGSDISGYYAYLDSSGDIKVSVTSAGASWDILSEETLVTGVEADKWQHIAIVRDEDDWMGFLDGEKKATVEASGEVQENSDYIFVGGESGSDAFVGYIDEFRISPEVARWTADFDAPRYPY